MQENEIQLIEKCQHGDLTAFRELYEQHKDIIYNLAYRIHGNHENAEDSVQDAFVTIYKKIGSFRGDAAFSTWLYRVVVNTCLSNLKKSKRKSEKVAIGDSPDVSCLKNYSAQLILEQEIQNLSPGYRSVFILYEVEGFTHEEIGKIMRISPGTSKSQLHRAKQLLKKRMLPFLNHIKNE